MSKPNTNPTTTDKYADQFDVDPTRPQTYTKPNTDKPETTTKPTEEDKEDAKRAKAEAKAQANADKWEHAQGNKVEWDVTARKFSVQIFCTECGAERTVFTSDLFQVDKCEACTEEARKTRRAEKRKAKAEAKRLAKEAEEAKAVA